MTHTVPRLQLPLFQNTENQHPLTRSLDVEDALRDLLKRDLTFKGEKTDRAIHKIHAFAAKFPPQLPRLFVHELSQPGEWVLDPMAGSGTTIVEAILANRNAIGVDLDPLAVMIEQIKSTPVDLEQGLEIGSQVLASTRKKFRSHTNTHLDRHYSPQANAFFEYWFEPSTIQEIATLAQAIQSVGDSQIRMFLQVVLSSTIITKSGSLTRARDLAHSRPHRDLNRVVTQSAFDAFAKRLHAIAQALLDVTHAPGQARIIRADTRSLPLRDNSVDLIVTSPPYAANAIDYMRGHKFSLIWLGHEPTALTNIRRQYIGSELRAANLEFRSEIANTILQKLNRKAPPRAAVVAHYYREMESALREMMRVLAFGKAAILVVGSSNIQGIDIRAPSVLAELAESVGFRLVGVAKREILRDARMMPTSKNTTKNGIEARMHEEGVIGLVKPPKN